MTVRSLPGLKSTTVEHTLDAWHRWWINHTYLSYLLRRLGLYVVSLWGAFTVTFLFFHMIPGNPIQSFLESLQQQEVYGVSAGQEVVEHYKKLFGLEETCSISMSPISTASSWHMTWGQR